MVKVVFLVKRREGVTHEQLIAHWQDPHIPAVRESVKPDHYRVTFLSIPGPTTVHRRQHLVGHRGRPWNTEELTAVANSHVGRP